MAGFPDPGARVGRYRVVREVGRGPLGRVYEATDTLHDTPVALKILVPRYELDRVMRARLAIDLEALAALASPQVVPVSDYDEHDGRIFVASTWFAHGSLQARLDSHGPLGRAAGLALGTHLAKALYDAHAVGVVHGGVKPANVFRGGGAGTSVLPQLGDFGATLRTGDWQDSGGLDDGAAYLPPERAVGGPVDERGDVYGLGALLHAVLTGRPTPALPGGPRRIPVVDDVDAGVNAVLDRALQDDPEARYPDVAAMGRDLTSLATAAQTGAAGGGRRTAATVGAGAVAAGTVGAVGAGGTGTATAAAEATAAATTDETTDGATTDATTDAAPDAATGDAAPADTGTDGTERDGTSEEALPEVIAAPALVAVEDMVGVGQDDVPYDDGRRRRTPLLVGGVAVVALLAAGGSWYWGHQRADDGAKASGTTSSTTNATDGPAVPTVEAAPAYRAVAFTLTPAKEGLVEVDLGKGWQATDASSVQVPTAAGGQKACLKARTTTASGEHSRTVEVCGTSSPPTLRAVRVRPDCIVQGFPQVCYRLEARGFRTGTDPVLEFIVDNRAAGNATIHIGRDGTGTLPGGQRFHFADGDAGKTAIITLSGHTYRWKVAHR
jgi:hypothetical protein